MGKHERRLRKAAKKVAEAGESREELMEALKHLSKMHVDWFNAMPRDNKMRPVTTTTTW